MTLKKVHPNKRVPTFFAAQIEIPIPNKYLRFGIKSLCFCRNKGLLMINMDKEHTVPKWG